MNIFINVYNIKRVLYLLSVSKCIGLWRSWSIDGDNIQIKYWGRLPDDNDNNFYYFPVVWLSLSDEDVKQEDKKRNEEIKQKLSSEKKLLSLYDHVTYDL